MMITFSTQASANITMFREDALHMLNMMGHTNTVPGSILAADVPEALNRLKIAVDAGRGESPVAAAAMDDSVVSPATRAQPLIHLMSDAAREGKNVLWGDATILD
ncbi:MAG: DUF1840 domain-containing protein [Halothiobacillus sp.]|nr:DUF1840 domain-containing protein [Halothiobacillus sp.]